MRILLACEESQAVTREFRALGHEAYSCDILPTSGDNPEWHIQGDVLSHLKDDWDMIIGFPPCTYMTNGGAVRMYPKKGQIDPNRYEKAMEAKDFFMAIYNASAKHIAIENPLPMKIIGLPEKTQVIQPYEYGDPYSKKTCLWLKGLPKLEATNIVEPPKRTEFASGKSMPTWYADAWKLPKEERAKLRSKTFDGISKAMAIQWSNACKLKFGF